MLRLRNRRRMDMLLQDASPNAAKPVMRQQRVGVAILVKILTSALVARFGSDAGLPFHGAVLRQRRILDIGFPRFKFKLTDAIGDRQYHGKRLDDFKCYRLLVLNGCSVLCFEVGEASKDPEYCVTTVTQSLRSLESWS